MALHAALFWREFDKRPKAVLSARLSGCCSRASRAATQGVRGVEFVLGDLLRIAGGDEEEADTMVRHADAHCVASAAAPPNTPPCPSCRPPLQMWRSHTTNTTAARLGWGGLCAASLIFVDTNHEGNATRLTRAHFPPPRRKQRMHRVASPTPALQKACRMTAAQATWRTRCWRGCRRTSAHSRASWFLTTCEFACRLGRCAGRGFCARCYCYLCWYRCSCC